MELAFNDFSRLNSKTNLLLTSSVKISIRNYSNYTFKIGKDTVEKMNSKIHPSFHSILNDASRGGILMSQVIYHIHNQNKLNVPLFLTSRGIKASHDLINMINLLPVNNESNFKGDNLLFEFLSKNFNKSFRFNMMLSLKTIRPNIMYNLPIENQKVIDGDCSGIYCFLHTETGNFGIGSALSFRSRLLDHINSFRGHRQRFHLHDWILANGGLSSVKWAPIISFDNIVQEWYNTNYAFPLSRGGTNLLQGFGQFVSRIMEQCIFTHYKPFFNIKGEQKKDIIFFNFTLEPNQMSLSLDHTHVYQAWADKEATTLIAESNSYNSLADQLNISVGSVRNNMNWYKGMSLTNDQGENYVIYLKEKGVPFRYEQLESQVKPSDKYSLIELKDRSLYDLAPGKIYVIKLESLEVFGVYNSQRELWKSLNPNSWADLEKLHLNQIRSYLDNRIGRYFNLVKPGGISTEKGKFYFCKHPDYLPGLTKKASGLFAVDTFTGLAKYYANNSQAGDRGTVRRNRNNNTITKNGIKYINEDVFLANFPDAVLEKGATYRLNKEQLANLPDNPKS